MQISYIGYVTKDIKVTSATNILAIKLVEDSETLDEVVVVGYGVQKKVNLTGAVATVSAGKLESRATTNLSSSLSGLVSGVSVNQGSGKPGSDGANIRIRGIGTFNAKKIGIIGHSAGGIIAFIVAKKDPSIAFVVSLAGAGVRGDSLMLKQVELISKSQGMPDAVWQGMKPSIRNRYAILQQTDKTPEELQKELYADVTKTMSPEQLKDLNTIQQLSAQISSMTSPWYLHFMRYDPGQDLKKLKCPVLALNGKKDIQVDAVMNLTAIQKRITGNGNKNVTVKAYPNLNHLFQTCEKGTLTEYGQLEETINPEVLKDIIEWIRKQ